MANQADGYIIINTKISTDGMKAGTAEIEAACRRAAAKVASIGDAAANSANKAFSAFQKQNNLFAEQSQKVSELKSKLREISGTKVETAEFKGVNAEIDKLNQKLEAAIERQIRFAETGGNINSRTFAGMEYDIENLRNKIAEAENEKTKLISAGGAYTSPDVSKLTAQISAEEQKLQSIGYKVGEAYNKLGETVSKYTSEATKARKSTNSLSDSTDKLQKSISKGFKNFLRYGIGIRSVFALFNRIRRGIGEGLKNIVQVDPEANKAISTLRTSLGMLKNALAAAFTPIIEVVTPYIKIFVQKLVDAINYVGMFFAVLAGKKTYTKAIAYQEDYAASLNNTSKAAASVKKNLSGLDQISNWQSDSGTSGASGATANQMFEKAQMPIPTGILSFWEKISSVLDKIKEKMAKIFSSETFQKLSDKIKATIGNITTGGKNIFSSFGKAIENSEPEISAAMSSIKSAIETVTTTISTIWGDMCLANSEKFREFTEKCSELIEDFFTNTIGIFTSLITLIYNIIRDLFGSLLNWWEKDGKRIWNEILDSINDIKKWLLELYNNFIAPVVQGIIDEAKKLWDNHLKPLWDKLLNFFTSLWNYIKTLWDFIKPFVDWITQKVAPVFAKIIKKATSTVGKFFGFFADCIGDVIDWFSKLLNSATSTFTKIANKVKEIFEGIKEKIKPPINGIIGFINKMINGIVTGINAAINAMNKLQFDVPDWVPLIGGKKFGFNISPLTAPQIPYLATGAVIPPNAPFMAYLGDQNHGKNLEAPESLIRKIVREESGDNGGSYTFIAELDGEVLFKKIVKKAEIKKRSIGKNPLLV